MSEPRDTNKSVILEIRDSIAIITLDEPPRNTMTLSLLDTFSHHVSTIREAPDVRALVIRSNGKHFCAGAELKGGMPGREQALGGVQGSAEQLRSVYRPFLDLIGLPIPTIAAVQGSAVGGGLGLAVSCDFRIASQSSQFLAPFAQLGIHPGMGLTHLLPRLIGPSRAMEMLLMGRAIPAKEALQWGLVSSVVSDQELHSEAFRWASMLAEKAPAVVRWSKKCIHQSVDLDPAKAADREALAQALTFQSEDAAEGLQAFFEKRPPVFTGR